MYIVYIQQVVKVLKNIYVISYKSNYHPFVNSLLGRVIDRFFFFLGLSSCCFSVVCVVCKCVRVCVCVSVCVFVTSSVSDTQNAYIVLFLSVFVYAFPLLFFILLIYRETAISFFFHLKCTWRPCPVLFRSRVSSVLFRSPTRMRTAASRVFHFRV